VWGKYPTGRLLVRWRSDAKKNSIGTEARQSKSLEGDEREEERIPERESDGGMGERDKRGKYGEC